MDSSEDPTVNPENTSDELLSILNNAKISPDQLCSKYQRIRFSNNLSKEYKLLQIDSELLSQTESGLKLTIRGELNDAAVICTEDKTFLVKEAEISNTMLLVSNLDINADQHYQTEPFVENVEVMDMRHTFWELQETRINIQKLKECLAQTSYCGPEKEKHASKNTNKAYSLADLLDKIPCSEVQLKEALNSQRVCLINGKLRLLDFDYLVQVTTEILKFSEENSWHWKSIDKKATIAELSSLEPQEVLEKWFDLFSTISDTFCLDEEKICRLFAEIILSAVDKMYLTDFETTWQESVPDGMKTDLSMLRGLAIVESDLRGKYVRKMAIDLMANELDRRMEELFSKRPKWTLEEITPYLEAFVTSKDSVNSLLMKFCRCTNSTGQKVFTFRKFN